jgi:hypothetical protein
MRLQRAVGQLSLSGVSCYAVRDAVSRRLADFPLALRARVRVRGPRALWSLAMDATMV